MRRDIVLGGIIGLLLAGYIIRKRPCSNPLLFNVSPTTTLFAFDLHGVVLTPDYAQIARIIWYKLPKLTLIKFLLHPFKLYSIVYLMRTQGTTEQTFDELCKRYTQLCVFKPLLVELLATQWLNAKNITMLYYLKNQGYKLIILSNIWPSAYKLLIQRYPVVCKLFSGVYLPSQANNYAYKPQQVFYEGFKHYLEQQGLEHYQVIFVENIHENIDNAHKAGLHALHVDTLDELVHQLKIAHTIA